MNWVNIILGIVLLIPGLFIIFGGAFLKPTKEEMDAFYKEHPDRDPRNLPPPKRHYTFYPFF
ncbi:MAG: hypothetical protein LBH92_05180 [Bacteroidales bacterium]|jgi:hypothetical protein|nr:hypothetical protein [Bacteroidales bacterium]